MACPPKGSPKGLSTSVTSAMPLTDAGDRSLLRESWVDIPTHGWVQIAVLGFCFLALHRHLIVKMGAVARANPDWSHAFLVPFFSLYFLHQHRARILNVTVASNWWGLPIFIGALGAHFIAIFPVQSVMLQGYTMILELLGLVLLMAGWRMLRAVWFPICYLGLGIQISGKLWRMVAWRLQTVAAQSSVVLMNLFGLDAEVTGSTIELWRGVDFLGKLNVAEACSGLRMLMAFMALGVAIVYLVPRPWWSRAILLVMTVPIAVAVNVVRVTITGFLHLIDPSLSAGDFHVLVGMLMVFPALAMFLFLGWILDNILVQDEEDGQVATSA